jgi:hypothetical protein
MTTKLEELEAARVALDAAHKAVIEAAYVCDYDYDVAVEAYDAAWDAYKAELDKQEENSDDH